MRRSVSALVLTLLVAAMLPGAACKKKTVTPPPVVTERPPAPPPAKPLAPTISLSAAPSTITRGESATLTWRSENATSVAIDGGVGNVQPSGNRTVSPAQATTYNATATGPGGRATASARVTVTEGRVTPPPTPTISDREFFETRVKDIYFDYDQYDIRDDARSTLNSNARALADRSSLRAIIEGHCDERGSEKYNLALGDRRANAAKEYLVGQGVSADRLETISYGEERPADPGHTEESWARNRRAHFVMK